MPNIRTETIIVQNQGKSADEIDIKGTAKTRLYKPHSLTHKR